MKYICANDIDWGDEFNVFFFDIISEEDYEIFKYAQSKNISIYVGFGTNEWYDDFSLNDIDFEPISDSDAQIVSKYIKWCGISIIDKLYDSIIDYNETHKIVVPSSWDHDYTVDELKQIIDNMP